MSTRTGNDPSPPSWRQRRRRWPRPSAILPTAWFLSVSVTSIASSSSVRGTLAFSSTAASGGSPREPPPFPDPSAPEQVVQNQLFYYRTSQLDRAFYDCCSPENREASGSFEEFERSLEQSPYDLIKDHDRADVLLESRPDGIASDGADEGSDVVACLVRIRPNRKARRSFPVWFWWELSRVVDDSDATSFAATSNGEVLTKDGGLAKWMVDCIVPDFEDLDFETESLTIENFLDEGDDGEDELTIYWNFDE